MKINILVKRFFSRKFRNSTIVIFVIILLVINRNAKIHDSNQTIYNANREFPFKANGCRIPSFDPFDKSILKFIFKVKPFICSKVLPLVESDLDSVYIDEQQLQHYNVSNQDKLSCCYQPFWRVNPIGDEQDDKHKFGECIHFDSSAKIYDEFVKITCKINQTFIYKDYHAFVPIKKPTTKKLKVLVVGLDSVSRANFYRQMPLTKDYLLTLNAIEILRYNKVGENTLPNLIPVLTGLTREELKKKCWPTLESKFDNCDFIWKNYSKAGYVTAYAEDSHWIGLFNYEKRGFTKQPTDYYWRTFMTKAEDDFGESMCLGSRPTYTTLLDYTQKFVLSLKNETYFGIFWASNLPHADINLPKQGDRYYKQLFQSLKENNILNDTLVIMCSDHGIRWGPIQSTLQGYLESRLPFLYFIFPPWFIAKYPSAVENLKRNANRLTTPFDLHETLSDVLTMEQITPKNIKLRSKDLYNKRGISLFLPIPKNRTCLSANVPPNYCTCQYSVKINTTSSIVQEAGRYIVGWINTLLKSYMNCVVLELDTIIDARITAVTDHHENNKPIHDYTIILRTKPSGAIFDGTVRCVDCKTDDRFNLTGTIGRLNLYENQSACVKREEIKQYCYCG